jgi:cupin superfamily acireductone dioxygenase involved in methionine salvage
MITADDTSSLDLLKNKIERVYGYQRPVIDYRELVYKSHSAEEWKVQFVLLPGSVWGKEKYKFKFFKATEAGAWVEQAPLIKEDHINKDALLKYAQDQTIASDERWERFVIPGNPYFKFKSKNFKVFELNLEINPPISVPKKSTLSCNLTGIQPFCLCIR